MNFRLINLKESSGGDAHHAGQPRAAKPAKAAKHNQEIPGLGSKAHHRRLFLTGSLLILRLGRGVDERPLEHAGSRVPALERVRLGPRLRAVPAARDEPPRSDHARSRAGSGFGRSRLAEHRGLDPSIRPGVEHVQVGGRHPPLLSLVPAPDEQEPVVDCARAVPGAGARGRLRGRELRLTPAQRRARHARGPLAAVNESPRSFRAVVRPEVA
mmetsp:Transcript_10221/g.39943  ORF Transcript_10221/g.39943 Transcript_10221/m.39943 type:complete len:213 (+) Transcript_10221:279-917(+)